MAVPLACMRRLPLLLEPCLFSGLQRGPLQARAAATDAQSASWIAARRATHRRWLAARAAADSGGGSATEAPSSAAGAFITLAAPCSTETEVKKSRFLAHAWPCSSADEAMELISSARDSSATHNCYAYKVGQQYRSNDDGEPGGTAGRPILAAIEGEGLDGVAVLVVRFFGGVKLGAGGLVRAYGGAARDCLRAAERRQMTPQVLLRLQVPFELLGPVYPLLEQHGAVKQEESYDDAAGVGLLVRLEAGRADALRAALADATSGRVLAEPPAVA